MKEAAGAFPGRNELWGGRLLWLREQQSLVRQEHPLQLAKRTGRLQRESQSTRARAHRGSTVRCYHDPTIAELATARERTREMKEAGELRLSRQEKRELRQKKWAKFLERYPDYDAGH